MSSSRCCAVGSAAPTSTSTRGTDGLPRRCTPRWSSDTSSAVRSSSSVPRSMIWRSASSSLVRATTSAAAAGPAWPVSDTCATIPKVSDTRLTGPTASTSSCRPATSGSTTSRTSTPTSRRSSTRSAMPFTRRCSSPAWPRMFSCREPDPSASWRPSSPSSRGRATSSSPTCPTRGSNWPRGSAWTTPSMSPGRAWRRCGTAST